MSFMRSKARADIPETPSYRYIDPKPVWVLLAFPSFRIRRRLRSVPTSCLVETGGTKVTLSGGGGGNVLCTWRGGLSCNRGSIWLSVSWVKKALCGSLKDGNSWNCSSKISSKQKRSAAWTRSREKESLVSNLTVEGERLYTSISTCGK